MNISHFSLRRPVFAIVLNLLIILFGVIGFKSLGIRDYPAIDPPIVSVRTSYPGANADIIESQITEPLEKAINGISGIKNISSMSSQGSSSINVEFELSEDLEAAANDVRDKVSQAVRSLPSDLDAPPVVSKADASSDAILAMTVRSNTKNQLELTEFANNNLLEKLQTIPGVSSIMIWGEKKYAMRIWLNPVKLSAYGLTPGDVQMALQKESLELPSGKLSGNTTELSVRTFGQMQTEEEFNNLIVKNINGAEIRIRDIGVAVLGPENEETVLKESGIPMIALAVSPQPGANYVEISNEFYKRYQKIKEELPDEFEVNIALDQAKFIKQSILEVEETLVFAILLVILIIYLFFRDWLIAIRPLIDIPVSLIGAFFIMYISGFTINVLTLLAIVLATGLVVDDGIVVTENIYKKMEAGMNKYKAAREGSQEIYFAVISTSITLAVVFLPIIFLPGFVGRLFREFGVVVAGAVLISAFVSLTLTPVLNVKMTRSDHKHSWFYHKTEPFFRWMEDSYHKLLTGFFKMRWVALAIIAASFGIIFFIGTNLKSELAPLEDRSQFRLMLTAPEGTSFDYMDKYVDKLSGLLIDSIPEKQIVLSVTSPSFTGSGSANTGFVRVVMVDPDKRLRTQEDIVNAVQKELGNFSEGKAFLIQEQTIAVNRRGGLPVQFVIQNNDFEKIKEALPKFLEEANKNPVFQQVDVDLKFNKPELQVEINRTKAAELGVSVEDIAQTLQLAYSNRRLGYFTRLGKQYQVIGQVDRNNRDQPADLKQLYVRNKAGQSISIDNLVTIVETVTTPTIYHYNRYKSATISAGLAPDKTLGDGIKAMREIGDKVLDQSFSTALSGSSRDFEESSGSVGFAFTLALILIFLILAAQFESFIDPIIIMVTVPLAIAGAVLSLWIFDQTLNIFSQIGMIMLIGLVTKNGILIVDFANKQQAAGVDKKTAAIEAATMRLRPILMTSLAMALGALPLAISIGAASTSRIPLGIVIIGGIIFSLILTLLVVPVLYSFISSKKHELHEDL
ncbi:MAG TPA: efflux RND transporter permease subunit [Saprospiraceae bacterium]|nr:efflux RND transporter permease subunit [Saprospiraceae bacterium]MCC6688442.1 efflux RND transporter permease subunit [Saprospiraceae bacterium]HMV22785.1 efflux RND transporter permease subunit [Saprospiraceae bacterium]HMX82587.1 efflux RND transporter permease subunit [Saprospiraceae bacterium]HMX85027.1 efflux RND transporter permease subunit [Saprospiraceae bacterium]